MDYMKSTLNSGKSLTKIQAKLRSDDSKNLTIIPDSGRSTDWLLEGLSIEEAQLVLFPPLNKIYSEFAVRTRIRQEHRQLGSNPSPAQVLNIETKRQSLAARIRQFHAVAGQLIGVNVVNNRIARHTDIEEDGNVSDSLAEVQDAPKPTIFEVENHLLVFPSNIPGAPTTVLADLRNCELRLRKGRAHDALDQVRQNLSSLSFQYINQVRHATTTAEHLHGFQGMKLLTHEVSFHHRIYNRCQRAIVSIDPDSRSRYLYLRTEECGVAEAIARVNAAGESQTRLPWFWGALAGYDKETSQVVGNDNSRLLECLFFILSTNIIH